MMHPDCERILLTEQQIAERVRALAARMDGVYAGKKPLVVCILKGSALFFADLVRCMDTESELDFMAVSSYGSGTESSGALEIKKDLSAEIAGRDVLLVEDIIDTGNTLYRLKNLLQERRPKSVRIVTLLDKPARRRADITPDFTGFTIEDEFVVGYGLDYNEQYRNLPYIGILKRSVYAK